MGYILITISLVLGVFSLHLSPRSQKYFHPVILFSTLIILGLSYGLPDDLMYRKYFYNSLNFSIENAFNYQYALNNGMGRDPGYMFFAYLLRIAGLEFVEFKFFLYLICVFILYVFVYKQSKFVLAFFCMYLVYPMAMDGIQQRNYIIEIFLFIAFYFYCHYENSKSYLYFCVIILIASMFHSAALAFLPFVLFDRLKQTRLRFVIYFYLIICLCMPLYNDYIKSQWFFMEWFLRGTDTSIAHYSGYMQKNVIKTDLKWYFVVLLSYLCMAICSYFKDSARYTRLTEMEKKYISKVKKIVLYNFCFFPLYPLFSDIAIRLPRDTSLLIFMALTILIARSSLYYKYFFLFLGITIASVMGRLDLYQPGLIINVDILMNQNYLFEFLGF